MFEEIHIFLAKSYQANRGKESRWHRLVGAQTRIIIFILFHNWSSQTVPIVVIHHKMRKIPK